MGHRSFWFILFEFIAIVFGVFLGGYLAERRGDRDLEALIERSKLAIEAEMVTNYEELLESSAYHLDRFADVTSVQRGEMPASGFYQRMTRGFSLPQIQTGAYDAAIAAGLVVYFDTAEFAEISRAYSVAQVNDGTVNVYISALLNAGGDQERVLAVFQSAYRQFMVGEDAALQVLAPVIGREAPMPAMQEYGLRGCRSRSPA